MVKIFNKLVVSEKFYREYMLQLVNVDQEEDSIAIGKRYETRRRKRKQGTKMNWRRKEGLKVNSPVVEKNQENKMIAANAHHLCSDAETILLLLKISHKEKCALRMEVQKKLRSKLR